MIYAIAAIDTKRGIANQHGMPWHLPTDKKYYLKKIHNQTVLVGAGTYKEPRTDRHAIIASRSVLDLKSIDKQVNDAAAFLRQTDKDIWVIGGAEIYAATIDYVDKLFLTLIDSDFDCTKFFPEYEQDFECIDPGESQTENGINFRFT
ncbi:dihydrofolate reductase, partial [Candidatus Saccharibacteria bacterium]